MTWAVFPIFASVFYCISACLQNYLTDNAIPKKRAGSYAVMHIPGFLAAIVLLFALFGRAVLIVPFSMALGLMVAGVINVIGATFYYRALQKGDTIDITIIGQLSPLVSLGLGLLILKEAITVNQAVGFIFIMIASLVVVFGDSSGKTKKKRSISPVLIAICFVYMFFSISSDIVFAYFLGDRTSDYTLFAQSFFFFEVGSLLAAVAMAIVNGSWRKAVKKTFLVGPKHAKHLAYSFIDNISYLLAEFFYKLGLILSPIVALVTIIGKVGGLFSSLFINIILGKAFPKIIQPKKMNRRMILQYSIAAVLIVIGVFVMN